MDRTLYDGTKVTYKEADEEHSCNRCGRTVEETPLYLNAQITPELTGTFCKDCRDDMRIDALVVPLE